MQPCPQEFTVGLSLEMKEIRLWLELPSGRSKEIQWAFLQEWALRTVAEPGDLDRERTQRCSCCCLAVGIPGREAKPLSLTIP